MKPEMREALDAGLLALFITVAVAAIVGSMVYIALQGQRDEDTYQQLFARRARIDAFQKDWAAKHCKRTAYDKRQPVFLCDDGNVYEYQDMPKGEQ